MSYEFTCLPLFFLPLRDSIFDANNRQPAPPSVPPVSSYWRGSSGVHTHLHEMEYQYSVAPPTHNITSPPTTPMTPSSHLTPAGFGPPPPLHGTTGGPVYQRYVCVLLDHMAYVCVIQRRASTVI